MARLAAVEERKPFSRHYRSARHFLTHETDEPQYLIGKRCNLADIAINKLPAVWEALATGRITVSKAEMLLRLAEAPHLLDALLADLAHLLTWAENERWPKFKGFVAAWQELADQRDPRDLDDKHFDQRGFTFSQDLDGSINAELRTPPLVFAQIEAAIEPVYKQMFDNDWNAARNDHSDLTNASHLTRTDAQRWHDALIHVIRAGAGGRDPGAAIEVVIITDVETVEREAEHQATPDSSLPGPARRSALDAESYRCETLSGLRLTPSTVLLGVISGTLRFLTFDTPKLNFEMSRTARAFTGPLRTALIIRDRHCTEPGCQTPAHRCEADHTQRYIDGGPTVPTNGAMRCRPGHRHKTRLQALGLWPQPG